MRRVTRSPKRRRTAKEKVLAVYPDATFIQYPNKVQIHADARDWEFLGGAKTERAAWAGAARRLKP